MFRGDPAHSGVYAGPAPRAFHRMKWKFPTGDRIVSSPVWSDDTIYFGGDDGNIYAVDAESGRQLWKHATGGPAPSTPAVIDGVVYTVSYDGKLHALDARTGGCGGNSRLVASVALKRKACTVYNRRIKRSLIRSMFSFRARWWRKARFTSGAATAISMRSTPPRASYAGNSKPAMSCMLRRLTRTAFSTSEVGTVFSTRSTRRPEKRSGAFTAAKTR